VSVYDTPPDPGAKTPPEWLSQPLYAPLDAGATIGPSQIGNKRSFPLGLGLLVVVLLITLGVMLTVLVTGRKPDAVKPAPAATPSSTALDFHDIAFLEESIKNKTQETLDAKGSDVTVDTVTCIKQTATEYICNASDTAGDRLDVDVTVSLDGQHWITHTPS